jgi:hypothetical protein
MLKTFSTTFAPRIWQCNKNVIFHEHRVRESKNEPFSVRHVCDMVPKTWWPSFVRKVSSSGRNCDGGARHIHARGYKWVPKKKKEKKMKRTTMFNRGNAWGEETSRLGGRDERTEKYRIIFGRIVTSFYIDTKCTKRGGVKE